MYKIFELISKEYDKEIEKKCKDKRLLLIDCLQEYFYDEFCCEGFIKDFKTCIDNVNKEKNKKYIRKFPFPNTY